jgi:hypothetical protein
MATLRIDLKARFSRTFAVYLDRLPAKILSCRFVQILRHNRMSLFPFYGFAISQKPEHCDVGVLINKVKYLPPIESQPRTCTPQQHNLEPCTPQNFNIENKKHAPSIKCISYCHTPLGAK